MPPLRSDDDRYGKISITLHWLGAIAVLSMLASAIYAWFAPNHDIYADRLRLHAALGISFYLLIAARIIWHLIEHRPRPLAASRALRDASRTVHIALLTLIGLQLVTGPLDVWSGGWPIAVFDWFAIPSPLGTSKQPWHEVIGDLHQITGYAIALLLLLHAAAAAKHHFLDRDGTVLRMLGLNSSEQS